MVNPGYFDSTASEGNTSDGYYVTNPDLVSNSVNDKLLTPLGRIEQLLMVSFIIIFQI